MGRGEYFQSCNLQIRGELKSLGIEEDFHLKSKQMKAFREFEAFVL